MTGKYAGLQARIKRLNTLAYYIPCAAHSLNLVDVASVNCCLEAVNFFELLQELYAFCVGSTKWWNLLTKGLVLNENGRILTRKTLSSSTRWHCRSESVKANIYTMLNELANNEEEKGETHHSAGVFAESFATLKQPSCVFYGI